MAGIVVHTPRVEHVTAHKRAHIFTTFTGLAIWLCYTDAHMVPVKGVRLLGKEDQYRLYENRARAANPIDTPFTGQVTVGNSSLYPVHWVDQAYVSTGIYQKRHLCFHQETWEPDYSLHVGTASTVPKSTGDHSA